MMKLFAALLLAPCTSLMSQGVQAPPLTLPVAAYPHGARIGYRPDLSNQQMDCLWGFFCEGNRPNFHFQTEDQLHRLAGWAQFASIEHHGEAVMGFELFASRYDPVPEEIHSHWSELAFRDLKAALRAQRYSPDRADAGLLPAGGGALVASQQAGRQDLVIVAWWSGDREIEAVTFYDRRSPSARHTALTSLALQMHLASKWSTMRTTSGTRTRKASKPVIAPIPLARANPSTARA